MISEQIRQKAREWHIHNDFEYWSDEEVAAFAESILSGGADSAQSKDAEMLLRRIVASKHPEKIIKQAADWLKRKGSANILRAADSGTPAEATPPEASQALDLHIESLRETLELAHASLVSFRIGALLDVWDQLPNDILSLEELSAVRKKIAELRKGMEITK